MEQPEQRAEGAGPFTTRLTWHRPGGETVVWESRLARRRGSMAVQGPAGTVTTSSTADAKTLDRLRRLNALASGAFFIGGGLFSQPCTNVTSGLVGPIANHYYEIEYQLPPGDGRLSGGS